MELIENKRMNKDIVEFEFKENCSPLKRQHLSQSIKEIIKIKNIDNDDATSKEQIFNYIIEAVNSTSNALTKYKNEHKKENIDTLLSNYHNSIEYTSNNKETTKYKEISQQCKKRTAYLIKENSEIKKDNYDVMFESIYIVINELLNKKKTTKRKTSSVKRTVTAHNSPEKRKEQKHYNKSFAMNVSLTEGKQLLNNNYYRNNAIRGNIQHKTFQKSSASLYNKANALNKRDLFEKVLLRKCNKHNSDNKSSRIYRINLTEDNGNSYKVKDFKLN